MNDEIFIYIDYLIYILNALDYEYNKIYSFSYEEKI